MGLSLYTEIVIQNNDSVKCDAGGPTESGKYCGWILLDIDGWHPLLNSDPIYDSHADAVAAMQKIVDAVKTADLTKHSSGSGKDRSA